MRVVLRHDNTWLLIKDVYAIRRQQRRRGRQRRGATPYGTVAVSLDKPPIDGLRYTASIEVPATKVMRFIVKMFEAPGNAVVLVEPHTVETYIARIYAKSREEAQRVAKLAESIIAQLYSKYGSEEEYLASEVEELEEEESEEE